MEVSVVAPEGGGLYRIKLSATHYYGGRAKSFSGRWGGHLKDLRAGVHGNSWMQNVFNKYGVFEPEVLLRLDTEAEQIAAEQQWLNENYRKGDCVNLSPYATGGNSVVWDEEARKRHSEAHMGYVRSPESISKQVVTFRANPESVEKARASLAENSKKITPESIAQRASKTAELLRGRTQTPESVEKRAAANRGRKNTDDTKKLMSESAKKRASLSPTVHDQETRALISAQQKGRIWINDGTRNQRLPPLEAQVLLDMQDGGWSRGRFSPLS